MKKYIVPQSLDYVAFVQQLRVSLLKKERSIIVQQGRYMYKGNALQTGHSIAQQGSCTGHADRPSQQETISLRLCCSHRYISSVQALMYGMAPKG